MAAASPDDAKGVSVLFVCLGNICRSTMAEGVFRDLTSHESANQHHAISTIDSCGTGAYHAGDRPDSRTLSVLRDNGITNYKHKARRVRLPEDFEDFDYILAMDRNNYDDLKDMANRAMKKGSLDPDALSRLHLFGEYGGKSKTEQIGDPYYGGRDGFETAFEQVTRFGKGLLKHIEETRADGSKI